MKTCPVSGMIVDVMEHAPDAIQIVSHHGKWYSNMFSDGEAALAFRATFDLQGAVKTAREETDSGRVRLVGEGWATQYMTPVQMKAWRMDLGEPPKRRTKSATVSESA